MHQLCISPTKQGAHPYNLKRACSAPRATAPRATAARAAECHACAEPPAEPPAGDAQPYVRQPVKKRRQKSVVKKRVKKTESLHRSGHPTRCVCARQRVPKIKQTRAYHDRVSHGVDSLRAQPANELSQHVALHGKVHCKSSPCKSSPKKKPTACISTHLSCTILTAFCATGEIDAWIPDS